MPDIISSAAITRRRYWISEIKKLSGDFVDDTDKMEKELSNEINKEGFPTLIDHLRLCGSIPEEYGHDSSEEKLYSKYTDNLLSISYQKIGLKSIVLSERADAADVEAYAKEFNFVADAKAFRLSRTAKNQKDFKVQAMDGWKKGKPYAMVVCPIYQLPNSSSQIYQQATSRNVCIFTYSHLALLVKYASVKGNKKAIELLAQIFESIPQLNPTKSAQDYWITINRTILNFDEIMEKIWAEEKNASIESIKIAKEESLIYLASVREKIMMMDRKEAIKELIKAIKLDNKIKVIQSISDNGIFGIK